MVLTAKTQLHSNQPSCCILSPTGRHCCCVRLRRTFAVFSPFEQQAGHWDHGETALEQLIWHMSLGVLTTGAVIAIANGLQHSLPLAIANRPVQVIANGPEALQLHLQ